MTTAADVLAAAFAVLEPDEQEVSFARLAEIRLQRIAGEDGETARHIRSLRAVAAHVGEELTPDIYRAARRELVKGGEEAVEFNALVRFFGSWRLAKEALELSVDSTPLQIEARFRRRLVGKIQRYREATLRETLVRCAEDLGRPPLVIEYEHWRQREIELAKAGGDELFLPSSSPFRRIWGSWDNALIECGFAPEEVEARLESGRERSDEALRRHQF
jgi:hypothetical protein